MARDSCTPHIFCIMQAGGLRIFGGPGYTGIFHVFAAVTFLRRSVAGFCIRGRLLVPGNFRVLKGFCFFTGFRVFSSICTFSRVALFFQSF